MALTDIVALLGILSIFMFVGSLLLVPWLVSRLPEDYFLNHRLSYRQRHPVAALVILIVRNVIGVVLFGAGIAMLFLPGQGVLTMLLGLSLTDFPGKHKMVEWSVQRRKVQQVLNWIRRKEGKPEFVFRKQ